MPRKTSSAVPALFPLERVRTGCDSVVAMGARTRNGRPIFAKNSDRPAAECQPLKQAAAADHPSGGRLACQYMEIEQVAHTLAFVGAGPWWLWGLEHGLNERGVAIGNHTIFTRDTPGQIGLQGMDLVRLGLERGASAEQAMEVIIDLIERYGQGGSGFLDTMWPYNNSFLIADAREAWLLEVSGRQWAARRTTEGASASNHVTITDDWQRLSADCEAHARAQSWWDGQGSKLDFAAAYRDETTVPAVVSSGRYSTTCGFLAGARDATVSDVWRLMRDHYEGGEVHRGGYAPDDERYFSVCEHADPVGTTTASMVTELVDGDSRAGVYWAAFTNPCVSPYIPLLPAGRVPAELLAGGETAAAGGAWWRFHTLLEEVAVDFAVRGPLVRDFWRGFENGLAAEAEIEAPALAGLTAADATARAEAFNAGVWGRTVRALDELLARVRAL